MDPFSQETHGGGSPPRDHVTGRLDSVSDAMRNDAMVIVTAMAAVENTVSPEKAALAPVTIGSPMVTPPLRPRKKNNFAQRKSNPVPHTYRDFSKVPDVVDFSRKKTGGVTQPFPEKLHEMLTMEANKTDSVYWLPHGRAFIVRNPKDFTQNVMPRYVPCAIPMNSEKHHR